tara:strand:- start:5 stop:988 length:984 start_codon:yes stop_codon:yes gene_type:complete
MISVKEIKELANSINWKWKGKKKPRLLADSTEWICQNGHDVSVSLSKLKLKVSKTGKGQCQKCSSIEKSKRQNKYDEGLRLAKQNGFVPLNEFKPAHHKEKVDWIGKCGHVVNKSLRNAILYGCNKCKHENHTPKNRKTKKDYLLARKSKGIEWIGDSVPKNTTLPTVWKCKNGCVLNHSYQNMVKLKSCPNCRQFVNGKLASDAQIKMARNINAIVNYKLSEGRYADAALPNDKIVIEYDSFFWHGDGQRRKQDRERNSKIKELGWKLLVIKSNWRIPSRERLEYHINKLKNGSDKSVMKLNDWGRGPLWHQVKEEKDERRATSLV